MLTAVQIHASDVERHELETRALVDPDTVLKSLPAAIAAAKARSDQHELALLYLAEANACRVIADWLCQRNAAAKAREAAQTLGSELLAVRGLIAESRASMALQDYTRGERLLGDAELKLKRSPNAELSADVQLAYSSLSNTLGKHKLSAEYAERGLKSLDRGDALPMQARLLRNRARALSQLGQFEGAQQSLMRGLEIAEQISDPKLSAELYLESARVARTLNDVVAQRSNGNRVLELAKRLKNSQLAGLAHEVLGLAALNAGDNPAAIIELQEAHASFKSLGLPRDELRIARLLIGAMLDQPQQQQALEALLRRFLELDRTVIQSERAQAADDFDARLKYAQQEFEVGSLQAEAAQAQEREAALASTNRLTGILGLLSLVTVAVLAAFFEAQRRATRRLKATMAALRESEARATDLLRMSRGFVFLHDPAGRLLMVNPATARALGVSPEALQDRQFADFISASAQQDLAIYLERVVKVGEDEGLFEIRQSDGSERHWRYSSRFSAQSDRRAYVIAHAVDVTEQVQHAELLRARSEKDALTGAYNRRYLEAFETTAGASARWGVVNIDLDHFKRINDIGGHQRGDQVLIDIARFLEARVASFGVVIRTGGDEFLLLLGHADQDSLEALLDSLRDEAKPAPCAFSVGASLREGRENLAATMARADHMMYSQRRLARGV